MVAGFIINCKLYIIKYTFVGQKYNFSYVYLYFCGMEKFEVHILGCGSAKPTLRHHPSAQLVNLREKLYLIDCGEGTQVQFQRARQSFSRLNHIFLSHLHGDHIFGLIGLLSTLSLSGRTQPMHIYAHEELEGLMRPWLDFFCTGIAFDVVFHPLPKGGTSEKVFEDRSLEVWTIPLRHRVPCCGFLFREKPLLPHIRRDMIDFLEIPYYEINNIKQGAGWTTSDGDFYPHERLVTPAAPARTYAYCSDTAYLPENADLLRDVDVLYHEATFGEELAARAVETCHSTARQAALLARSAGVKRLIIGHYSSRYQDERCLLDEARSEFPNTELAAEGRCFNV